MKKLSFAIIGPPTQNSKDLYSAVKKIGHDALIFEIINVAFETKNGSIRAFYGKKEIIDFDVVIFRGYNMHIYETKIIAKLLTENKKTIIEKSLAGFYVRGKMQQAIMFSKKNIPHPLTCQALDIKEWKKLLLKMKFPIMAKLIMGRKGRNITKFNQKQKAIKFFSKNKFDYLAQEYYPVKSDFRVFVVGNKVIGGFERFIFKGEYKSNIQDTPAKKIKVGKKMGEIAIRATKACGYEIAGVDLLEHNGKIYVIEVNVAPQWEKFKEITEINPAEHIIKYAIKKHVGK